MHYSAPKIVPVRLNQLPVDWQQRLKQQHTLHPSHNQIPIVNVIVKLMILFGVEVVFLPSQVLDLVDGQEHFLEDAVSLLKEVRKDLQI